MSFNYKNPITPLSTLGNISVLRKNVFGTNFSILSTGGYMEVYNVNELYYTIPSSTTGLIEYSGNTIPIQLNKGTGSPFSFDVLTLNSDNISSGRRRLGMLVYVIDQDQVYQYQIPNFISLWNSATGATGPGGPTVVFSDFGTTIKSNTPQGASFISAWTANTVEGISGETSSTAVWKKLVTGGGGTFTGGTVTGSTIFTNGLTANTFSASTYLGLPSDIFITGGTFNNNTDTLTLNRSSGSSITITGFTDYFTTGATLIGNTIYFNRNDSLSAYTVNLSSFTPAIDVYVTGGTYSAGTATFTNNTGGTFNVSGFFSAFTGNTSATCISDIFVSNITSCSPLPLNIQPTSNGNVIIANGGGNVGIGTSPSYRFHVSGRTGNTELRYSDTTSFPYFNVTTNNGDDLTFLQVNDSTSNSNLSLVFRGYSESSSSSYGKQGDGILYASTNVNGLNIINNQSVIRENYIRFYAGGNVATKVPDIHIQGSGDTNGYVGIGTSSPTEKLEVSGKTKTINLQITSGATNGYILTSDSIGNAIWKPPYGNFLITTAITISAETLTTGYTYYGIVHTGNVNLTLPNPSGYDGYNINIKDESGNAGIYRIRLTPLSGLIDGNNYVDMNINYMSLHVVARNNNWWII
jgi:hypothetical protein